MSKQNLEKSLKRELNALNEMIDQKIIRGLPYSREAKRHKFIVSSLSGLKKQSRVASSWFSQTFSTI